MFDRIDGVKACSRCKVEKPLTTEFFSPLKKARDGLHSWCKACLAEARRADRAARPEHYAKIDNARRVRHLEKRKAANREIWARRKHVYKEKSVSRWAVMRPVYNENRRLRFAESPAMRERRAAANKSWYDSNQEHVVRYRQEKWANADNRTRLRSYFGSAICHCLKGSKKGGRGWQTILGYTKEDLALHLERQFLKGMSWDNYGEWHIDHIRPVTSFQFETVNDPDFLACWSLPNLRPMWRADNIRKRDKIISLL